MLRTAIRAAPLVQAAAPKPAVLRTSAQLQRLLGSTNKHVATTQGFTDVIESKATSVPAVGVALIGRAMVFLNRGDETAALADLEAASGKATAPEQVGLIAGLQARCVGRLLATEKQKATVSGTDVEAQISTLGSLLTNSLQTLAKVNRDWAVTLAQAEHAAASGQYDTALAAFRSVRKAVAAEGAAAKSKATKGASPITALAIRFEMSQESVAATKAAKLAHKALAESADIAAHPVPTTEEVAAVRLALGDDKLPSEVAPLLASVLACAEAEAHFVDTVCTPSKAFGPWTSEAAARVHSDICYFAGEMDDQAPVDAATVAKPPNAFHCDKLGEALKTCPKGTHILDHVTDVCGVVPKTPLAATDAGFFREVERLDDNFDHHHKGTALVDDLYKQVGFRAAVGEAEVLTETKRFEDAAAILDEVVRGDEYVEMWRALLCQGRALAAAGRIDESDAAFQMLHALKKQPGVDIPLIDENRYKSAF